MGGRKLTGRSAGACCSSSGSGIVRPASIIVVAARLGGGCVIAVVQTVIDSALIVSISVVAVSFVVVVVVRGSSGLVVVAAAHVVAMIQIDNSAGRLIAGPPFSFSSSDAPEIFAPRTIQYAAETAEIEPNIAERMDDRLAQIRYHLTEASPEAVVHPDVDQRIGYGVTHGQVVRDEPDVHDALMLPDIWPHVADHN